MLTQERKINNLKKAVDQLLKLTDILKAARNQQINVCKSKLDGTLNKWQEGHHNQFYPKFDELNKELDELYQKLENLEKESQLNHQNMVEMLEHKMEMVSDRYHGFIKKYNEQKKLEFDQHNTICEELTNMDQRNFDTFQKQIQSRENALTVLREKVSVFKPQRTKMEEGLRVTIEKQLISVYKSGENEDIKRKETTDELFKQINHYTKRIKSCIGNM